MCAQVEVKVAQTKEALAMQGRGRVMTARGYGESSDSGFIYLSEVTS